MSGLQNNDRPGSPFKYLNRLVLFSQISKPYDNKILKKRYNIYEVLK